MAIVRFGTVAIRSPARSRKSSRYGRYGQVGRGSDDELGGLESTASVEQPPRWSSSDARGAPEASGRQRRGSRAGLGRREREEALAFVVSPAYEGVDEGDRQAQAWGLVLDNLPDDEQAQVAFVFTNTPEERAEAEREARASGG
jgi:hypothetical protein